jgi:undecaprenyl diphosphate synthase
MATCVGIIMDGNRRWAIEQNYHILEGHRQGISNVVDIATAAQELNIKHLAVYAFSTENWSRNPSEVEDILLLFKTVLPDCVNNLKTNNVKVRFVGHIQSFDDEIQESISKMESIVVANPLLTLWICLSYGGRAEIAAAAESLRLKNETITVDAINNALWTAEMPAPDLIIRTGGEQRMSGFLTWQSIYSELFFVDHYWPSFTANHLKDVLDKFKCRDRRFGK